MSSGHRYSEEEHEFLRQYIPGHTHKEIVTAYNNKFDEPITLSRVESYISRHHLKTGFTGQFKKGHIPHNKGKRMPSVGRSVETQFKKGNLPHNTKPIGCERINKDGYIEVKIKMRPTEHHDNWIAKQRLVWEEHNGPVPKGCKVIFLDGNKRNFDIKNLALVTNAEHLELTRSDLRSDNTELTSTGVFVAKSIIAVRELKKSLRRGRNNAKTT